MRPERLVPVKWRFPECARMILPVAVILKRLAAPRCVFSFFFGLVEFLGIAGISPQIFLRSRTATPAARLAANLALPLAHPFWALRARREHCLPCAAWFRSGRARRFHPAVASSSRGLLPGAPSRVRDGKSWRGLCGLRRGSE